jgi:hypothetical protein
VQKRKVVEIKIYSSSCNAKSLILMVCATLIATKIYNTKYLNVAQIMFMGWRGFTVL